MDELTHKIATAQLQQNELRLKQASVTAKLEAHQTDSTSELARLKSEMQTLQRREAQAGAKGSAQFGEKARTQLEHALAMDQEYQTELNEVNEELQQQNKQMDAMRAELKGLQTGSGK
ncbi:MAG: hypothetical protein H7Y02_03615 [Candidatus Obscuribacterales bacterium]|nr:hypothetical protein [Steroidobacteraceae bacterium]